MSKILIIVKKELLRILTDKRLCFTTIIMPGLMIFIMYALVGNVMSNTYSTLQNSEYTGGIIRMCEQVAASGNTLILYSA